MVIINDNNADVFYKIEAIMVKKVSIQPGCITCGLCEFLSPEIFEVSDISRVKPDAPVNMHGTTIKEAAERCPVQVITYEEEIDHGTDK
jgi:ferredoxin